METMVFIVLLVVAMVTGSMAQNISFGSLPQGNYTADSIAVANSDGLNTLFDMAVGFVNVVFRPFSELEAYIRSVIESPQNFGSSWQEAASFEVGFITCLVFGLLFVIFVPLVGSIMCCCRCCCKNCGGRLEQSEKRSRSCYRQCLCGTMLILTTLMAIPTVFVFLTNEWVRDVVKSGPAKTIAVINDMTEYVNLLPVQVDYATAQYSTVDANVRPLVQNFNESVGVPLQAYVTDLSQDSMNALDDAIKVMDDSVNAINSVDQSLTTLQSGMTALNTSLATLKAAMDAQLGVNSCTDDPVCGNVSISTNLLTVGFDVSQFSTLQSELDPVNNTLNSFDIHQLKADIENEIATIPDTVQTQTQSASTSAVAALDDADAAVQSISDSIPNFTSVNDAFTNINNSVNDAVKFYDDYIDQYTYIAGLVLGSMLAVIVASYLIGLLLGICGSDSDTDPTERSCSSNCGGIMLMVGVGLSFIFSWLLMILVIVLFTVGGHGERYGCQSLEGPNYEALSIVEDTASFDLAESLNLPANVTLTVTDVLRSCENDASAYNAFKLEYVLNVTQEVDKVTSELATLKTTTDDAVGNIDLSSISVYSEQNQNDLLALKNSGVGNINFTEYLIELGSAITATNLTAYAQYLNDSADNFSPTASAAHADAVRGFSAQVMQIQTTQVDPLQDDYDDLKNSINVLVTTSDQLNTTVDALDQSLTALNNSIQSDSPAEIQQVVDGVYDQINGNITAYTDWITDQIMNELGKCKPFYNSYTELIGVFCDYFMDTINGLWFSLGWAVFFLIPSAIIAMKLMKFYRKMEYGTAYEDSWDNMELGEYTSGSKANGAF